ncbi:hypothetical protein HPP92_024788 [Vanilla planifolia]|uniref:Uncharacterized protein n=1 Tax=Vanilla planifolia TaxID=51239 RepID=A0A835PHW1_VANPL|nr:hypothetical protein HPP92_024788 [Vanilla planifolia]
MAEMVGLRDVFVVAPATFHPSSAPPHHDSLFAAAGEHPIIPLLTAAPCLVEDSRVQKSTAGIQLWQPQPLSPTHLPPTQNPNPNPSSSTPPYLRKPVSALDSSGILTVAGGQSTCQDCGNQAKKDCSHRRCRTCCKSRGFDCSTHIKSTWVPAARRRERQLAIATNAAAGSSASTSAPKKPRLISSQTTTSHTSTSNTPSRSFDTSSSHQEASFRDSLPGNVRAPAVFKCVRVTSIDDGEDEYAYQAMVTIGGHVFKGFLYDQGVDAGRGDLSGNSPITDVNNSAIPNISELHLGAARSAGAGGRNGASSSSAVLPTDIYGGASAGGGFLGGAPYDWRRIWYQH